MAKNRKSSNKNIRKKSEKVLENDQEVATKSYEDKSEIAMKVLIGKGKNPYYYGGITIQNFEELQDHLKNFSEHEAGWLADWIDYLGDNRTAVKIREEPSEFKTIINQRYLELKRLIGKQ